MGGLYNGRWEKLTYHYPQPWRGTFISVKVDDDVYVSSEVPVSGILMDDFVSRKPSIIDSSVIVEWVLPDNIKVVEVIRHLDNRTNIEVSVENLESIGHEISVRFHLDTMLGFNDGAPIYLPGRGLTTTEQDYGSDMLSFEYWKAYNTASEPTIVATGMIDPKGGLTQPSRIITSEWKKSKDSSWDYNTEPGLSILGDSAVILYYSLGLIGPGSSGSAVLGVGSEEPVLPKEKDSFGVTEILVDRLSGDYCPGDEVSFKVDALSEAVRREGVIELTVTGDDGAILHNRKALSFDPGILKTTVFSWNIPKDLDDSFVHSYDVKAALVSDGVKVDERVRQDLVHVRPEKCIVAVESEGIGGYVSGIASGIFSIILLIIILVLLAGVGFFAFNAYRDWTKGMIEVSKLQDGEDVLVVVRNGTDEVLKDVVIEDSIPENAEIDVHTLNVERGRHLLLWPVGDLKPGRKVNLVYRLKDVAVVPEVTVRWEEGEETFST